MKFNRFSHKIFNKKFMKHIISSFLCCLGCYLVGCGQSSEVKVKSPAFDQTIQMLIDQSVPLMGVDSLSKTYRSVQLLDAREKREFKVSHIEGATWVGYDDFNATRLKKLDKKQPVVVYCSVGYRSEKIGEKLKELGFEDVSNLYGGIFEWSNQGYPLVDKSGEATQKVHAYDQIWGVWLEKGEKVY